MGVVLICISPWLRMLRTFSWLIDHLYLLWRKSLQIFCPLFLIRLSSYSWVVRFLYIFWIPVLGLIHVSQIVSFRLWLAFHFLSSAKVLILMKSTLSFVSFDVLYFFVYFLRNLCLSQGHIDGLLLDHFVFTGQHNHGLHV